MFWMPAIECLRVDLDSPAAEIEEEMDYWSDVLADAIELRDQETKAAVMQVLKLLAQWYELAGS